jgi:hypothetical protein
MGVQLDFWHVERRGAEQMTWIKTLRMDEDDRVKHAIEAERQLYPAEYRTPAAQVDRGEEQSITASHSLIPDALYHSFAAFGAMLSSELPLERRQHEMIATIVSVTNRCHY